jgi:uncharacterized protein (DUF1697 family)
MARYAVLLRGINVGGNKKIAMADLRQLLSRLGYTDVVTHLQSGNALFTAPGKPDQLAADIEAGIVSELGMKVSCLIRTRAQLQAVVAGNPFGDLATDPSRLLVMFLSGKPDPARLADLDPATFAPDLFAVGDRELYLWCPNGISKSKLTPIPWDKRLQLVATGRNWNTVTKLLALTGA